MFCASIFLAYEVERKDFPYAKFLLQNTDNMWTIDGVLTKHFFVIYILLILYINVCVVLVHMQVVIE